MTLEQARELAPEVEVGGELRFYKDTTPLGTHRRPDGQAGHLPEGPRSRTRHRLNEYNHRAARVLTATVKRLEPMDVIFDLGKAEARMPKREQSRLGAVRSRRACPRGPSPRRPRRQGPHRSSSLAPRQPWSRTSSSPKFPRSTTAPSPSAPSPARAGERTKIAVMSRDKDVDPRRRLRWHEGHARPVHHPRTARVKRSTSSSIRRRSPPSPRRLCNPQRSAASPSPTSPKSRSKSSSTTPSSHSPSARRARTSASPPSSSSGRSTSRAKRRSVRRSKARCRP